MKSLVKIILLSICLAGISCSGTGTQNTPNTNANSNAKNASAEKPRTSQANTKRPDDKPGDKDEHITFAKGSTKKTVKAHIADIKSYVLTAGKDQILWVSASSMGVVITLKKGNAHVVKTDDGIQAELKEDGDYVIEVANTGDSPAEVTLTFEIQDRGE